MYWRNLTIMGVKNSANYWFKNYLDDREQFVSVHAVESKRTKVTCGVPRGFVLGPL